MGLTKATYSMIEGAVANILDFGADPTGSNDSTSALTAAIQSLRSNPTQILDTIGGNTITVYTTGTVYFPKGVYKIQAGFQITQDECLKFIGAGSRRNANAWYGATTILFTGTSSTYGFQLYRNGARNFTLEDMDICYESSGFTGSVIDTIDSPGLTLNRCYVGTYGITGGTRLTTAKACIRSTYDEFMAFTNCTFSGAERGWWSDDVRTELGNTFGGFGTLFTNCTFYDFTENHVYASGNKTRVSVEFNSCAFNPITVSPSSSCINMDNVDGITVQNCTFTPSTSSAPAAQWILLTNTTGQIQGNNFNFLSACAYIQGWVDFSSNVVYCTDGVTFAGGVLTGRNNEFSRGTTGWNINATGASFDYQVDIGPDRFKNEVTVSYSVPVDSALLSGRISYSKENDGSISKFFNASDRVTISNADQKFYGVSDLTYTLSILDTGRTAFTTGAGSQAFTLPAPVPGTVLRVSRVAAQDLTITRSTGSIYTGTGATKISASALAANVGGYLEFKAISTTAWMITSQVGTWTFA